MFIKQHSRDFIYFLIKRNHRSSLKHLEVNIQKIIIVILLEWLQELFHFRIIYCFIRGGVHIWNIFIIIFKYIL